MIHGISSLTSKYLLGIMCLFLMELGGSDDLLSVRNRNRHRDVDNSGGAEWKFKQQRENEATSATIIATARGVPVETQKSPVPKFYSPSLKILVQRGDRILLPCVVSDLGEDHILWRHETNIIAGSNISTYSEDSGKIRLFGNFTLEISNVAGEDEGEYECLLASPLYSLRLTHTVSVQDPPTVSVIPAKGSIVLTEGETAQIGCIPRGKPKPRINWSKRDGPIPRHHLKLFNESIITMEQVSRKHTGLYVCTADNGIGLPALGAVFIRVLHAPEVEVTKRRVHGGVNYKAQLICIVHADPKPEVQWLLGQKPVPLSDRIHTEARDQAYSLVINFVRESDFGMYVCTANNSYGFDLGNIEFSGVSNPPVVSRWETLPLIIPGSSSINSTMNTDSKNSSIANYKIVESSSGSGSSERRNAINKTKTPLKSRSSASSSSSSDSRSGKGSESEIQIDIKVQLFWAVECYSPLIDYRLAFRPAPTKPLTSLNEDKSPTWTELTIPADPSSTFLHTKSFILHGLARDTIYEATIKARNKYGWSTISTICYFSTFPNSTSTDVPSLKERFTAIGADDDGNFFNAGSQILHPSQLGRKNETWSTNSHLLDSSSSSGCSSRIFINNIIIPEQSTLKTIIIAVVFMTSLHITNLWHHHQVLQLQL